MIQLENVSKIFGTGNTALTNITVAIEKGEFVFLVGHTGSGKTTLLRLLVREFLPTNGSIIIDEYNIIKLPSNKIPELRRKIGVIFQDLKLLMEKTILENIALPLEVAGVNVNKARERAEELLEQVGIVEHKDKFPIQLSGGELERAAIARALALSPDILLADEPTGNLDEKTAFEIVDLLNNINQQGTTIIMAKHNMDIVEKLKNRLIVFENGKAITSDPLLLDLVTADILPASLEISTVQLSDLPEISNSLTKNPIVQEVIFQRDVVATLTSWTNAIRILGIMLIVVLSVVSIFIMATIIGIKISQKKEEIEVMQLLGATKCYISWPFIFEGIVYGIIGTLVGWLISSAALLWATPYLENFLRGIPLLPVPWYIYVGLLISEWVLAIFLGTVASMVAVRRYIK